MRILSSIAGVGFEEVPAEDSGQDSGGERWGQESPGLFDEEVGDGSLGQLVAFVEKDHFVEAFGASVG